MIAAGELWRYRSLLSNFTQRELTLKYRRSFFGWLWTLINPGITLAVYTVIFGIFLRVEPPVAGNGKLRSFALFLFAGLIIWNLFSTVVTGSMQWLLDAGPLLKKASFPAEIAVLSGAAAVLLQTITETLVLSVAMVAVGNVGIVALWAFPLLALTMLFTTGIALLGSLLNVYYRDTAHLVKILMTVLFYASPIVYPLSLVPERIFGWLPARSLILMNPLSQIVEAFRDVFYRLQNPSLGRLGFITIVSLLTCFLGWTIFRRHAPRVSEEL